MDLRPRIGLVHAEASHFHVAPRRFDRALSATPLDGRDQRMAMYRTISDALKDEGVFVGGVEHDDLTRRLLGLSIARATCAAASLLNTSTRRPCSAKPLHFSWTWLSAPFGPESRSSGGCRWPGPAGVSRMAGAMPIVQQLGEILLLRARRSIRSTVAEGVNRRGSKLVKGFFRWYTRNIGKEPVWGTDERV